MARKSDGTVYVDTLMDTKGFGKGVNTMQKQMGGLSSAVGKLGAVIATTFAVGKVIRFGKEAIDLGSDLQEVQNVVDVTFTTMNEQVNEFAKNAAESAGLSETMAKRYTGTFGAMAKAFGFAEGEAFSMSTSLTQLAGDVASFYNLTQDEAYTKLKSVFTGETESLKDLGVVMTQSALDAFAMAKGYGKTTKQMSEQEKVALRYAFVLDQLSAASGDFVRTQDSWANQTRILSLNFDSFKANIGQALINIFTPFLKVVNQIVDKMAQLSQHFVAFSEMLVGKSTSGGGGSPGEALAEIQSGYEDIANATDEATKAQKKYTTGLDEIRTFQTPETEGGGGVGIDFSEAYNSAEDTTTEVEDLENRFPKIITFLKECGQLVKDIFNDFKVGNFFQAGQDISTLVTSITNFFSDAIDGVDWVSIGAKAGEFLAGLDWWSIIVAGFTLKFNIWKAIAEAWFGAMETAPLETSIITAFAALKLTPIGEILAGKIAKALAAGGLVSKLGEVLALTFGGAGTLAESMTAVFGSLATKISGIASIIGGLVLGVTNFFDMWKNGFSWLREALMILGIALAAIGAIILGAPALIAGVVAGIVAAVATLVIVIKDNWDKIAEFFKKMINGIIGFINGLVSGFVEGINFIIGALNKISFEVPDWVPKIGGETIGFNIKEVKAPQIPYLATGAVIPPNAPFMAMLGDQKHGTNIEAPLDTIKQAVREVIGNGSGGQYRFTAQINRRTLFEEVIDEAKFRQSTTGRNPFDLA